MYNSEVPHYTSGEVMSQVSSYFEAIDNAIAMGDTNKRYQPATNTCYGPPVPVQANSYTTVVISPTADNTADIYNGYIYAEMKCRFTLSATPAEWAGHDHLENPHACWVGFKDAMDSIEKYEILANGITIYTQNQAIEESFVTSAGLPEACWRNDPYCRRRHKDVFNRKDFSSQACGTYISWSTIATSNEATIKLKIDLRRFLPLSNIKYLPAFAGKIELRLYFSTAGMVCSAVKPNWIVPHVESFYEQPPITDHFVPLGEPLTMYSGVPTKAVLPSTVGKLSTGTFTLSASRDYYMSVCETIIHCFGISSERYDALVQKYMQTPLTFPTQTLAFTQMSNKLDQTNSKTVQTVTPRFVDSIFFLFPLKPNYRTCFFNPSFDSIQLQCGGYGSIPDVAYGTLHSARMIENLQNALNVNSDTVGLNDGVCKSVMAQLGANTSTSLKSDDRTNFLLGFATESDGTFQQGQTSNTPITYTLSIQQNTTSAYPMNVTTTPIMGMLIDSTFSIQIRSDGAPPVVEVGAFDITSPVMM